ncbi:phosphatase PAP2 family protein [Allorhodopirellula heiligendammensis]|uniref:PAP2 superfamily protein n=1 Tax=Allorhodopirellula heiligendammensis TaxID=2714739 RepID=A0A5C6BXX2_9BACT|nr:phosphatase PAP2 family protein [Allorhodopirellula heiligendammensis]TWU16331.1 PAP2 superfamily protein [Allorhodopirellula heiligendammensis]
MLDQKDTPLDRSHHDTSRSEPVSAAHVSPRLDCPQPIASASRPGISTATTEATTLYRPETLVYMAAIMAMMVPVLTLIDAGVAAFFATSPLPRDLDSALELSLIFSHGTGVFLVLMTIMLFAPRMRWQVPRLATLALGGGAVATITKWFVLRPRPNSLDLAYFGSDSAWLWAFDWDLSEIAAFDASTRAFPSANVVTATALTIGLWIMLPRGRVLFATIWIGVLLERLHAGAHFLSDACGGIAIGLLWSFVCYHPKLMGTLFDRMAPEPRRRRRSSDSISLPSGAGDRKLAAATATSTTSASRSPSDDHPGFSKQDTAGREQTQTHFDERAA